MPRVTGYKLKCVPILCLVFVSSLLATACTGWATFALTPSPTTSTRASSAVPPADQSSGDARRVQPFDPARHVRFERISIEQGLSQSTVRCIVQDRRGFIWFGTEDGLNRYDGYGFKVYKHDPDNPASLGNNAITAIYEDSAGVLWVGTQASGLDRFDREREQFIHYRSDPNATAGLTHNTILVLHEDKSGMLWIGTEGGLNQFDLKNQRLANLRNDPHAPEVLQQGVVYAIYETKSGMLWFGTSGGLIRYDRGAETFTPYRNNPDDPSSLSSNNVSAISEDAAGALWVGTWNGGVNVLDPEGKRFTHWLTNPDDPASLSSNRIVAIHADRLGTLWIGTTDKGINQYDPERRKFIRHLHKPEDSGSLSNDNVNSIYEDKSGALWIGTFGGGGNRYDRGSEQFIHYRTAPGDENGLTGNLVFAIFAESKDVLWIGTEEGLNRLDRPSGLFTHYKNDPKDPNSLGHNYIRAIHKDRSGILWIGTEGGGLSRLEPGKNQFIRYVRDPSDPSSLSSNTVASIYEDASGTLWLGTALGLDRLDRDTGKFTHYRSNPDDPNTLSDNYIVTISPDRAGALWVGTNAGLNKFDPSTGSATRYLHNPSDPDSVSTNFILSVYQDHSGTIWVGTFTGGLNKLDSATGKFTRYREKQGLPNDTVYGILEDDAGVLWLSTNKGIAAFDPRAETFKNYDVSDGLQSDEFNWGAYYQNVNGEMFFGGVNGLTAFYPSEIRDNAYIPPVVLTQLTQGGETIQPGQAVEGVRAVTLSWPNNYFEFEFAALNYAQPQKNQYAYRLDGFDPHWNFIGAKRAGRYTNLPGGTYTLRLIASNDAGVWNEEGVSVQVVIVPPVWETWWFRGFIGFLLAAGVAAGYRLRVRGIRARNRELERQIDERTWALGQQTRALEERTDQLERQRQELQALYQADAELHRHLHLDDVLQALVNIAVDLLQVDKSTLLCWDEAHARLVMHVARGFSPESMEKISFARGEGFAGRVAATGECLIVNDLLDEPLPETDPPAVQEAVLAEGIRSIMHIPIKIKDEVFGVFNVSYTQPHAFGEDEQRLFIALAQRAALAIEGARYFDAEQRRAEQFRVINEVSRGITSILDVDQLLEELARVIQTAFGYYMVGIALIEGDELVMQASAPGQWRRLGIPPLRLKVGKEGVMGWVAGTGEPLLVPDVSQEPHFRNWPYIAKTQSELAVPLKTKRGVIGVLNAESDRLNAFDQSDLIVLQSLANQASVAIENAQRFRTEQRRAEQFRVIAEVGRQITSVLDTHQVLVQVARLVQQAFGYYHITIGLIEGDEVVYRVGAGTLWDNPQFQLKPSRLKVGKEGITGWVAARGEPAVVPDVSRDPRYVWMEGSNTLSELTVPIMVKGQVVGVLDAQSDRLNAFDSTDLSVLQSIAHQAGVAIENARLYERAQELAVMQERNRLARDLHDAVTQTLFSASLISDALPSSWESDPKEGRQLLKELRQLSRGALAEMRTLLLELRPAALVETKLGDLLRQLSEAAAGRESLIVTVTVEGDCKLVPEAHIALYRIAQEALNNVVRHSRATHVGVRLNCTGIPGEMDRAPEQIVELSISDDGRGFDLNTVPPDHFGVRNMRERAQAIGAELTIHSQPGRGTQIKVVWKKHREDAR